LADHFRSSETREIELASKPDVSSLLERVRARKNATETSLTVEKTLRYRDSDRY